MRPLGAVLLGLAFLAAPASAQEYLPLAKGNTWTYDAEMFTGAAGFGVRATTTVTAKVTDTRSVVGGLQNHVIRWTDARGKLDVSIIARAQGSRIRVVSSSGHDLFLLPGDLTGSQAHLKVIVDGEAVELDALHVAKPASITVPAGTFEAIQVSNVVKLPAVVVKTSVWYAAGTGPVQIEELVTTGGAATVKRTLKLKSFTQAGGSQPAPKPERPTTGRPATPPTPAKRASKPGALTKQVAALIASGRSTAAMNRLKKLVVAVTRRAGPRGQALSALEALFDVPLAQQHSTKTIRGEGKLKDQLLIARAVVGEGGIQDSIVIARSLKSEGVVKNCLLIVDGDITVEGYLKDCLILCTGKVKGESYVKDNLIVTLGTVRAAAYLKDNVIEAKGGASAGAYSKDNLFLNTRLTGAARSKGDAHTTLSKPPSALLGAPRKR